MTKRCQKSKMKKKLCPSRDQQWWIYLLLLPQVPPPHRVRLYLEAGGMSIASERPDSRMSVETKLIRRRVDVSSATQGCISWRVDGRTAGETRRIKKNKIQKTQTILKLELGTTKKNLMTKKIKLGRSRLHNEPVLRFTVWKSKEYGSDIGPLSPQIVGHIDQHRSHLLHGHEDPWKTTWRSHGRFEGEIWLFVEYSWISLFKKQFISEEKCAKIHIWDKYF